MTEQHTLTRRGFIQKTALLGTGLVLGTRLSRVPRAIAEVGTPSGATLVTDPNAFLRIAPDNTVTILIKHIEFGQGVYTGLATLVADELDAAWSQIRAEAAPSNPKLYLNYAFGAQGTGGSTAVANSFTQMRLVGASARAMLVAAAAQRWGVSTDAISVADGVLHHGDQSLTFGEVAEDAMKLEPPEEVALKDPSEHKLIGKSLPKLDTAAKTKGQAQYTLDIDRPGLLTVVVKHPEKFGANVRSFDAKAAKKVRGFVAAKKIPEGVAVYAEGFWPALKARSLIEVEWDESAAESRSSEALMAEYVRMLDQPGTPARQQGEPFSREAGEEVQILEVDYRFPYLAHAPMEPLDIVLERTEDGAEAWFGSQLVTGDHMSIAHTLGLAPEKVRVHVLFGGGSFGRRAQGDCHFAKEGAEVLKASPDARPIKLVYTREDDIQGGYYRPMYAHRLRAAVKDNKIIAWHHRIVGQSILKGTPFEAVLIKDGIDQTSVEGAVDLPYEVPSFAVELTTTQVGVPVLWWRSVGSTHTGFSTEAFVDELLEAIGEKDQVAGRLKLLPEGSRHAGVLRAVAELAGWPKPALEDHAYGVALHKSFGTYVAQIADVSVGEDRLPKVHTVWCAVDCGVAINPNVIAAQMEGGVGFGLGAALFNAIHLSEGRPREKNFDAYRPLRIAEMPEVHVTVVPSTEAPTGVGEPGVPLIAAAVANAFYRLTGERVRSLPFIDANKPKGQVA